MNATSSRPREDSGVAWIGTLPRDWNAVALKQRTTLVQRGRSPDYADDDTGVPIINQACIYWDGIRFENVKWQRKETLRGDRGRLRAGDLLINSTGTGTLGRAAVLERDGEFLADSHVTVVRTASTANAGFLRYVLQTDMYQGFVYSVLAPGATNQIELSREGLRRTPFPMPPVAEQAAIASFLDRKTAAIDALIAKKERLIELLQEKRQALITQAVTKGIQTDLPMKATGIPSAGSIPRHWDAWTVRDLLRMRHLEVQDGNHGELHPVAADYVDEGIPFLMANNVRDGAVDLVECKFIPKELADGLRIGFARDGDVLLTHKGTLGETAILSSLATPYAMLTPQVTYYRPRRILDPRYLYFFMTSEPLQEQLRYISSVQATRGYVGIGAQRDLVLVVPPIDEQRMIADHLAPRVRRLDDTLSAARLSTLKLREYRQALITAAVTGKIDVSNEAA